MKTKIFVMASALALLIFGGGCSEDNDPIDPLAGGCDRSKSWGEQTQAEADAWTTALFTLANSPSKANCEKTVQAHIKYIEALEKVNTCVAGENEAAFLKALKDSQEELAKIDCDGDYGSKN